MTGEARERYSRQILFSGLGEEGQERLLASRVAVVGCGALGSFQAGALARAGVGFLRLIDRDYIEISNLQRQWLYEESDAREALPKAVAAARRLNAINSGIEVEPAVADLTPANAEDLLGDVDLILDGADNFEVRYLINDFAVHRRVSWVYGAAVGSYGLTMPVIPGRTCCLRCLYPNPPGGAQPTCETAGVLGAITSLIASLQVAQAMRLLAGDSEGPARKLTTVDVWTGAIRQIDQPPPDPACPCCGENDFEYLEGARRAPISLCGRNAVQIHERAKPLNLGELQVRLARLGEVRANEFALRFFLSPYEMTIFPDGRAIIKGTTDVGVARSLYARYVGN
ncbi:MAG: ThiF family adenylyltransferase [Bryobacteraceae bacterium]